MRASRQLSGVIMSLAFCGLPSLVAAQRAGASAPDLQVEPGAPGPSGMPSQFTVTNAGTLAAPATLLKVGFRYPPCEQGDYECLVYQGTCPQLPGNLEEVIQSLPPGGQQVVLRSPPTSASTALSPQAFKPQSHEVTYIEYGQAYVVCVIETTATADAQGHVQESNEANNAAHRLGERKVKLP